MAILILECCQNHNGDREILKRQIHAAAASGADYCKMQSIRSGDLAFRERFEEGIEENGTTKTIKRPFAPEKERLSKLDLTIEDHVWFIEECRRAGIEPMTTIFNHGLIDNIAALNWDIVKVASYDCANPPFLERLGQAFPKIVISTGACYDDEIVKATEILKNNDTTFLHCVTIYPTPLDELHLARMDWLRSVAGSAGFSDHTLVARDGLQAAKAALARGATAIERHFTILEADESRDGPVSINQQLATELATACHGSTSDLEAELDGSWPDWKTVAEGSATRELSAAEELNRDYYRGRFTTHVGDGQVDNWMEWPARV